ncbi:MAG: diacylglycerol kinase family protein [Phycisphaerales bacterium]
MTPSQTSAADPDATGPRAAAAARTALVVLNAASGDQTDRAAIAERVERTLIEHSWRVEIEAVPPEQLTDAIARACLRAKETPGAIVVVGGGDGTIRSAAALALKHGVPLGLLPMGTMNLLPKDLEMPLDISAAAKAIATGIERRVDAGLVNGRVFLHSSVLGVVPLVGREREKFRKSRTWGERLLALWRAARHATGSPRFTMRVEHDGRLQRVRTYALAVANNPLSDRPGEAFLRESVDGGRLAVYVSKHRGRAGLFALLFTMGTGRWALDRQIEQAETTRVRISAFRRKLRVSNDGEVELIRTPLDYTMQRKALRVIVPREAGGGDAQAGAEAGKPTGAASGAEDERREGEGSGA